MIVVSDTSPIINLAIIGQLDLLRQLYQRVIIPRAVYQEIAIEGAGQPGAAEIQAVEWIEIRFITKQELLTELQIDLDKGEAEAIALAIELKADLLLIDEHRGRTIASERGIGVIGLLGVLIAAKRNRYIPSIKPMLDDLRNLANFWISDALYFHTLNSVGEK